MTHSSIQMEEPLNLSMLPPEILLQIFLNIPAKECVRSVSLVCSLFYQTLKDGNWWTQRKKKQQIVLNPKEEEQESFALDMLVCSAEADDRRWRALPFQKMYSFNAHFGTVNAARLFVDSDGGRRCISAGRDRQIRLWDLDQFMEDQDGRPAQSTVREGASTAPGPSSHFTSTELLTRSDRSELLHHVDEAHTGWIWRVTRPNTCTSFYSSGWDSLVKRWDITPSGFKHSGDIGLGSAVIGLEWVDGSEEELVCSTFLRRVCVLDAREGLAVVQEQTKHSRAVIGVLSKDNYIYSWSEDKLICLSDRRNMNIPVAEYKFPRSYAHQLSIGTTSLTAVTAKGGACHFLNPHTLEDWGSYIVHEQASKASKLSPSPLPDPVRGIVNTGGSLVFLSKFGKVDALSYGLKPRSLMQSVDLGGEPSRTDYRDGELVAAVGDGRLIFWPRPSQEHFDAADLAL